ncbi:flagellar motor protein MotB [Maridesulfovibrio bastinii]|uniref:flagellar motor protein MotB n=1 Tax=Maridesulfovibrio bastinii TaxID=47157 RepID=UPI0003F60FE5|nr:flagellar motor protein MotB [Maridesulfovibrio bastinii]
MPEPFQLKKKAPQGEEGGWALTLADMMTLLLCFFVLLLAIADVDKQKYKEVSDSLSSAMGVPVADDQSRSNYSVPGSRISINPEGRNLFDLQLEISRLVGKSSDAIEIRMRPDAVAIILKGAVFFDLGRADLTARARSVLGKIVPKLVTTRYNIVVEGHSDNLPIHSSQFPSNWELSSARACAVARYLIDAGLSKKKIKVLGMADTRPLVPNVDAAGNSIPENQKKNRRVTLLIYDSQGQSKAD